MKHLLTRLLPIGLLIIVLAGCAGPAPATATPPADVTAAPTPSSQAPTADPTPEPTPTPDPTPVAATLAPEPDPLPWDKLPQPVGGYTLDTYPVVDGSTATRPLSQALAYYYTGIRDMMQLEILADHTNTDECFYRLVYGNVAVALAYEPSAETLEFVTDSYETHLEMQPIGRDALVFLVNEGNPIESLTIAQVQDIYQGKITNWKQVGGADLPIVAFQRPERSGSQVMMSKLVMGDLPLAGAPGELMPQEMGDLIREVSAYSNEASAIGFTVFYYASEMYMEPGIKILPIEGVVPTVESISKAEYPFINDFYAVVRADAEAGSDARKLFDTMRGPIGKQLIEAMGYAGIAE